MIISTPTLKICPPCGAPATLAQCTNTTNGKPYNTVNVLTDVNGVLTGSFSITDPSAGYNTRLEALESGSPAASCATLPRLNPTRGCVSRRRLPLRMLYASHALSMPVMNDLISAILRDTP